MSPIPQHTHLPPMDLPTCEICDRIMSPARAGPQCGGMLSTIHVGLERNGVTCRYQDDSEPVSTWRAAREGMKKR